MEGGGSVKKVGAKFVHEPVVLKPSVGGLDCETIYQLGVETAALGKVPNAPTLNAMDWPGGLRRRKHQPGKLPKISRVKLSKSASAATLAGSSKPPVEERPASVQEVRDEPTAQPEESDELPYPILAWGSTPGSTGGTAAAKTAQRRPYGELVPHNQKVPRATEEGKAIMSAHLTAFDTKYAVTGSRPGRTCDAVRFKPQAVGPVISTDAPLEAPPEGKGEIPLEQFDEPELYEKFTEDEWLEACELQSLQEPGCANAEIRHWNQQKKGYVRVPCWILGYDAAKQRYQCEVISTGEKKLVRRLAVRFLLEELETYEKRISNSELKREDAILTRELTAKMEEIPSDGIAPMSNEQKAKLIRLVLQQSRLETPEDYVQTLRELMLSAEASYMLAMKFAILKERMIQRNGFPDATLNPETSIDSFVTDGGVQYRDFGGLLAPFLPKPAPHMGQVVTGSWSVTQRRKELAHTMLFDHNVLTVGNSIYNRFSSTIAPFRILDVERGKSMVMLMGGDLALSGDMIAQQLRAMKEKGNAKDEALPLPVWMERMEAHRDQVVSLVSSEWRTYIVSELSDVLADTFNFFIDSQEGFEKSYISQLLTKTDLILKLLLRQFVRDSLTEWTKFMQEFPQLPRRRLAPPPSPLLSIKVTAVNGKVVLQPTPEEVIEQVDALVASIPGALLSVKSCKAEMVPCMNFEPASLYEMPEDEAILASARRVTRAVLDECLKRPQELLKAYQRYEYILKDGIREDFDPEDLITTRQEITRFFRAADEVEIVSATTEEMPLFEVQCGEVIEILTSTARGVATEMLRRVNESAEERTRTLNENWAIAQQTVRNVPKNEEELAALKDYMSNINVNVIEPSTQALKFGPCSVIGQLEILGDFSYPELRDGLIETVYETLHWSFTVKQDVGFRISEIETEKTRFMEALQRERAQYFQDLQEWKTRIDAVRTDFYDFDEANKYALAINSLDEALQDGLKRVDDFNNRERLFVIELTERDELEDMIDDYSLYHKLWTLSIDFKSMADEWKNGKPLMSLNAEEVTSTVDGWFKSAFNLRKSLDQLPIQLEVCNALLAAVKEFKQLYPIIESLCHPAIEFRHWYTLFDDMDVDDPGDIQDIMLKQLIDMGVAEHIDKLEEIAAGAQKEYSLRKALGGMKEEWRAMQFETLPHKDSGTYLVKGIDEVQTLLDDHIVKTQAIRGSPFCRPFEKECREWEQKLTYIQESLDQLLMVQRTWLYLEPIFSSEDISRQMPGEAKKFQGVDNLWRQTLATIHEAPAVLDFADIENLCVNFTSANKELDAITKSLNDYLETKRLYFPRFFFLSNDELLSILSETKDPTRVQPHMNKAFEGVAKVRFDKNNEIIEAMISAEGEVVNLFNHVNVNAGDNKGNVEKWLLQVEASMTHCLRIVTDNSMTAYKNNERTKWVLEWPGQVVICVDMCYWTALGENYLAQAKIQECFQVLVDQLNAMLPLVRGELTKLDRRTLAALTTIAVHNRDVIGRLAEDNVNDPNAFDWMAQLRYYWCQPGTTKLRHKGNVVNEAVECEVKIVNSCLMYMFEYLGNSDRLVITPLTDRCYRTLMGAMHLYYGGAPEGPAGTGKTETVKDFAKALAVQCVVFNCSDGLDYIAMGKFFKGLASSGAWCCFDEFNRINVEVLSVIAQQVLQIQLAIREAKKKFIFEGTELKLVPSCAVNITMNPGYAGRAELPDNLKALFRPCAMMVPDYALIGEIFLYSYGFTLAKDIGRKATLALRLSSEQLSSQDHYDFGMRGLKSILVAAGALKRKYGDSMPEKNLALKGFLEVNEPKFTAGDIPLFSGIVGDLFPGVEKPPADNQTFEGAITEATEALGYQATKYHILKTVQLWETILVRHGLMTVGLPPCGKSAINFSLGRTLEALNDGEVMMPVMRYLINPKSIFQFQLYGSFDENTHEWSDGILAIAVRKAATGGLDKRQWVQLDGPVDAIWIEDMNTVLDDNKKLCLLSGEIIKLSPVTNMIFEVADLAVASPATVSRVGVVFMEPHNLGWRPMVKSWVQTLPEHLISQADQLEMLFESHFDAAICVLRTLKMPIPSVLISIGLDVWLAKSLTRLLEPLMLQHIVAGKNMPSQKEIEARVDILWFFSLLWTVGVATDAAGRKAFDELVRNMLSDMNASMLMDKWNLNGLCVWRNTPTKQAVPDPERGPLYDYFVSTESGKWAPWTQQLRSLEIPSDAEFHTIIVPTVDMVRNQEVMRAIIDGQNHVLYSGVTGTGKTVAAQSMLLKGFDREKFASIAFAFSAQTTHNQTQDIIDGKLDKRRKGVFGPPVGKRMLIFVDDLNMPQKDNYGAQGAIEILRQFMFQKGWYERKTAEFRSLIEISFIAAMGPPGAGKNDIAARYTWHYNLLIFIPYIGEGLTRIFDTVMKWYLGRFSSGITALSKAIVSGSIEVYETVATDLLPTPEKSHYMFNLRDISRIFQGICACNKDGSLNTVEDAIKVWYHEVERVFKDRLVNAVDGEWFDGMVKQVMETNFKKKFDMVVTQLPMIWGSFMDVKMDTYREITDHEALVEKFKDFLFDFNAMSKRQMNLVLFLAFAMHVARLVRILNLPLGNALCVGVGGSGRKSVTTLSSFVVDYDPFQIEISKNYGNADWLEDMKRLLMNCGTKQQRTTFLFSDTQVQKETFLEDISNILNTGEIPNLFGMEEKMQIQDGCTKPAQQDGCNSSAEVFSWFVDKCRKCLHIVLCLSPIGAAFRTRLRNYPSLVNCCTIDWFHSWPAEALHRVATQFLKDLDMDDKTKGGCVDVMVTMQEGVYKLTERFRVSESRYYYVTPTSYLELISSFLDLIGKQRTIISTAKSRYDVGLKKIQETASMIGGMQKELEDLQPVLKKTSEENAALMVTIDKNQKEAAVTRANVEKDEAAANEVAATANGMKEDCERDLAEAMPALESAIEALKNLKKGDIVEVKSMAKPPAAVILTSHALCIMMEVPPVKVKAPDGKGKVDDYWDPAKKKLFGDANLLQKLIDYDKDNMSDQLIHQIKPFEANPDFQPDVVKKGSVAAAGICKWVRAMIVYDRVAKLVGPKKEQLAAAQAELAEAMGMLKEKQDELAAVVAMLAQLEADFKESKQKQDDLERKSEECKVRLERAEKLLSNLGGEQDRWGIASEKLGHAYANLTGDIVVASGIIAYLGVFTQAYRSEICDEWVASLAEKEIAARPNYKLVDVIGDAVKIRKWLIDKLPNDSVSTENAIIQDNSRRWPLCIDPQVQANKWFKNMYSAENSNLKVLRLTKADYGRTLENAIQFGYPVLIENILETLDPMLEPLLQKAFYKAGNLLMIRLGDATIEYSNDFRFYLTSKLPNPHYAPEICVSVTLLNFVTTQEGLADQLLAVLVAKEFPEMEVKRNQLVIESAESKAQLKEVEDKILYMLAHSTGNILDDEELINTLASSKVTSARIEERVAAQERTQREIQETRRGLQPVADRSSSLFFVVSDLSKLEPMYQYSLEWFMNIYVAAIDQAEKARGETRVKNLDAKFIILLYENLCRSLFEKDKLLLSILLTLRMLHFDHEADDNALNLFFTGGGGSGSHPKPKPKSSDGTDWLSDIMWGRICELDKLPAENEDAFDNKVFIDFSDHFENKIDDWQKIYDSDTPKTDLWPDDYQKRATTIEKCLIMLALRPDSLVGLLQDLVKEKIGPQFLEPPPFDLEVCYSVSTPAVPLIFVLTMGADPGVVLQTFAARKNMKERLKLISLGQGQGPKANAEIEAAVSNGLWVVLQNCHLATSYMPVLEGKCENFEALDEAGGLHEDFRLWLTSMPSPDFPVMVLQNGIKMTVEPPKGLKSNMTLAYLTIEQDWLQECTPECRKLVYGVCFFHAIILDRRRFGPLGWNIPYQFADTDREISLRQLKMFLEEFDEIQYTALNYLVAECNYGGRVTDGQDRRTIKTILSDYITPKILDDNYKFSVSGDFYAPKETNREGYLSFVKTMPLNPLPEVHWLHQNADLTAMISEGFACMRSVVSLMPKSGSGGGLTKGEKYKEIAEMVQDRLPKKPFDIDAVQRKYPPEYFESMNVVLIQELIRFKKLYTKVTNSVADLKKAVDGLVVMSAELEEVGTKLLESKVPPTWMKVSFPSLKPMGGYVNDFAKRLQFMTEWVEKGPPITFWISGFFFTQAFLTGVMQNMARRDKVPIDEVIWNFYLEKMEKLNAVREDSYDNGYEKPAYGCYVWGLFLQGARWDDDNMVLAESFPKVLFEAMPAFFLKPIDKAKDATGKDIYPCPTYKTSERRGVLSTTGHSTNFVMTMLLPISPQHDEKYWTKRGVAMLTQLDE